MGSQPSRARSLVRAVVAVAVTIAMVGVGAGAASASPDDQPLTASLSGTVTDAVTGGGIPDASVVVLDADGAQAATAATGSTGGYTVSGLAPGEYRVSFSAAPAYEPVFWPTGSALGGADPVSLGEGEVRVEVDARLVPVPLASDDVEDGTEEAVTDEDADLETSAEEESAEEESIVQKELSLFSEELALGAFSEGGAVAISGRVTHADTGEGVANVPVRLNHLDYSWAGETVTSADGSYTLEGIAPGEYRLRAGSEYEGNLPPRYWNGDWDFEDAGVLVVADSPLSGIDVELEVGSIITGTVTRASDGSPVQGVWVHATAYEGAYVNRVGETAADGTYVIERLVPGVRYTVTFYGFDAIDGDGLLAQHWDHVSESDWEAATPVVIEEIGSVTTGIDASLIAGGRITGAVTREDTGLPVENVQVVAYDRGFRSYYTYTGQDGTYELGGLEPGSYTVVFAPLDTPSLASEYFDGALTEGDAVPVGVASGETASGVNASLKSGASISGRVVNTNSNVYVEAINVDDPDAGAWRVTGSPVDDGSFTVTGLPAGTYVLRATPYLGGPFGSLAPFAEQYYTGAATAADAQRITVSAGDVLTGYDFTLELGVNFAGTVSPNLGLLHDLHAVAYRWSGDSWDEVRRVTAWGSYAFAAQPTPEVSSRSWLPAGTYKIGFESEGYCPQYWEDAAGLDTATSLTPEIGTTRTGVDAVLTPLADGCEVPEVTPGVPTVSGSPQVGETLSAVPGAWEPDPVALSYEWLADGTPIAGATGATLLLASAQEGAQVSVRVTGSRPGYTSAIATSVEVGPVAPAPLPPVTPGTPSIDGDPVAGEVLTAVPGTWSPGDVAFAFQWSADGEPVAGATGATFVPGDAEVGTTVTVEVTGSKDGYAPASATSVPFGPITAAPLLELEPGAPTIDGVTKVGETLTVDPGQWDPAPVALSYQWLIDGEPVAGADGETFTPDGDAAGSIVQVTVRGAKTGYNPASVTSDPVGPVVPGDLSPVAPTIEGTPRVGDPLTVAPGGWGPAPVELSFQWLIDDAPLEGATGRTFTPTAEHVNRGVGVVVTGSKPGYVTLTQQSLPGLVVLPGILTVGDPRVTGQPRVGQEVVVDASDWGPQPLELSYQWLADGETIEGATQAAFTPDASLVGTELSVRVAAGKPGFEPVERVAIVGEIPPSVTVSTPRAERGEEIVVKGEYFIPGEEVLLELHSDPIGLGTVLADAEGTFAVTVTVPRNAEFGPHDIVATGLDSGLVGSAPLEVYEPAASPGNGTPESDVLSGTGAELAVGTLVIGILLLAVGGCLVTWRRRVVG